MVIVSIDLEHANGRSLHRSIGYLEKAMANIMGKSLILYLGFRVSGKQKQGKYNTHRSIFIM
jgi:hypothetical protein